ncbi:Pex19 protein, partial [Crucibulum laeve]
PPPTATTTTSFNRPRTNTRVDEPPKSIPGIGNQLDPAAEVDEEALSDEFAKELAKGMESLMREIAVGPEGVDKLPGDEEEAAKVLKAAWEAMLVDGMNGESGDEGLMRLGELLGQDPLSGAAGKEKAKAPPAPAPVASNDFQSKIKQAMDKLKESESNLKTDSQGAGAAGGAAPSPESLEALLASLGDLGLGEGEGEGELAGFLENMMGQLMSKDVLYEPLKELADSFPAYLATPPTPLSTEDKTRYENQLVCVRKILTTFDEPGYNDSDPAKNKAIVDLMGEMQSYGSPPPEVMGPLPAGLEGMPQLGEEGCVVA